MTGFPWFVWTFVAVIAVEVTALIVCLAWSEIGRRRRRAQRLVEAAAMWDGWLRSHRTAQEARR